LVVSTAVKPPTASARGNGDEDVGDGGDDGDKGVGDDGGDDGCCGGVRGEGADEEAREEEGGISAAEDDNGGGDDDDDDDAAAEEEEEEDCLFPSLVLEGSAGERAEVGVGAGADAASAAGAAAFLFEGWFTILIIASRVSTHTLRTSQLSVTSPLQLLVTTPRSDLAPLATEIVNTSGLPSNVAAAFSHTVKPLVGMENQRLGDEAAGESNILSLSSVFPAAVRRTNFSSQTFPMRT